ncbi:MAG: hypothetical protein ACLT63_06695 [Bacteroides xylanisolvens]
MIDYKEAKKYLLPTLLDYGFKERKDKSCKSCLVFRTARKHFWYIAPGESTIIMSIKVRRTIMGTPFTSL